MNNSQIFKLIDGEFTPAEAQEVLLSLIEYKIQFHNLKNFESEEKFGRKNEKSVERIQQLRETKKRLFDMIKDSADQETTLVINSVIEIESKKSADIVQ